MNCDPNIINGARVALALAVFIGAIIGFIIGKYLP